MKFKDHFSAQSSDYAKFRPQYPRELYKTLAKLTAADGTVWDCGTGNGQAAVALTEFFPLVLATDPSENQLKNAVKHPQVRYSQAKAEASGLLTNSVDLITVAQALHWFDHSAFAKECARVARPGGLLAVWCYELAHCTPAVDAVVQKLYSELLGPYWEKERKLVEEGYRSIYFPFRELSLPAFHMEADWEFDQLYGYLGTWSALKTCRRKTGRDPLEEIRQELEDAWGNAKRERIQWPLAVRAWKISD